MKDWSHVFWTAVVFLILGLFSKIIYDENKRDKQTYIKNSYVVLESGCVTTLYKGKNKYDCSVLLEDLKTKQTKREILYIGVLAGDLLVRECAPSVGFAKGYCVIKRR